MLQLFENMKKYHLTRRIESPTKNLGFRFQGHFPHFVEAPEEEKQ
jgi:hypothetical protein